MVELDIGNNYMSGVIPSWTGNMTSLESVIMRENIFQGPLPRDVASFHFRDLSDDKLSGALPSQLDLQLFDHIHLQGNKFTGHIRDNSLSGRIPTDIGTVSNLRVLLLSRNHLSGAIPDQLCQLHKIFTTEALLVWYTPGIGTYGNLIVRKLHVQDMDDINKKQEEVEFVTKSRLRSYKGDILNFTSGMDLSCNNRTGGIPAELGQLGWIHAMNLSHNHLAGFIPNKFSNLRQIESLDLSHNSLSGDQVPSELTALCFLAVFSVAYNNLTGRIPYGKAQFGTFENSSYEGTHFFADHHWRKPAAAIESHLHRR
ncbi:hypothetical protein GH714_033747 [Hevea brasiliensis]|uniref:Leucine-rich repeat-containing N-terminal plant-type domain-containing protein n=1 Tax=Hevea brasiliensis TaxID=3981 RepID=A0A6A6NE73_HEVBR|nr:hypothetical protein GH714_033747 [Hevea brasiliensis]